MTTPVYDRIAPLHRPAIKVCKQKSICPLEDHRVLYGLNTEIAVIVQGVSSGAALHVDGLSPRLITAIEKHVAKDSTRPFQECRIDQGRIVLTDTWLATIIGQGTSGQCVYRRVSNMMLLAQAIWDTTASYNRIVPIELCSRGVVDCGERL